MRRHRLNIHRFLTAMILGSAVTLMGCGGDPGPDGVKVTGSVAKDGKAQPGATVSFIAADQTKGESRGVRTDADGKFQLKLRPGAYAVTLSRMVDKKGNVPGESENPNEDYTQLEASGLLKNAFPRSSPPPRPHLSKWIFPRKAKIWPRSK